MRRVELEAKTKAELLELARKLDLPGRSRLSKDGLIDAILKRRARPRRPAFGKGQSARRAPAGKQTAARAKRTPAGAGKAPRSKRTTRTGGTAGARKPARSAEAKKTKKPAARRQKAPVRKPASRRAAATRRRPGPHDPEAKRLHGAAETPLPAAAPPARPAPPEAPRRAWGAPLEMPERYGHSHAGLMARDPYWLFAYWEIEDRALAELEQRLEAEWAGHRWVLRVFTFPPEVALAQAEEGNGEDRYDIELPAGATSWYINVGRADRAYRIAVGIITRAGRFHALARSNAVRTPRDAISPVTDEEWTRAPESYRRLYTLLGEALGEGGGSSAELGLLLRERLQAEWSSGQLGSMGSGAFAKPAAPGGGFWFVLDAELIVYGATEPDARVTVQGRPIALRPDGTFSLRFLLPDGTQVIDATAVSADGTFRKTITPTVRRETSSTETIEEQVGS
jgi:hypothetical protein